MTLKAALAANKAEAAYVKLGEALDGFFALAGHDVRPDQLRVLRGTGAKLMKTLERAGIQIGALLEQYDRFCPKPPPPPRPLATVRHISTARRRSTPPRTR